MVPEAIFHRLVQQDMSEILHYYSEEAPAAVGDRFFGTFLQVAEKALLHPGLFHPISPALGRADLPGFPYHFLCRETVSGIRVLVLRHDRRHPVSSAPPTPAGKSSAGCCRLRCP